MQVMAQKTKEAEITEQDSLLLVSFFFLSSPISCSIPVRLSISVVRCRTSDRFTRSRVFCRGFWEVFRCGFDRSCGVLGFAVAGVRFGFDSSVGGHACRIFFPPLCECFWVELTVALLILTDFSCGFWMCLEIVEGFFVSLNLWISARSKASGYLRLELVSGFSV